MSEYSPGGHVLSEEASVIVLWISHASQTKVTDLEITRGVQQQVARLQISVENIGRVDVLETTEDLVEEVADVVVAQPLRLQQLVEISLHEALDDVHVLHGVQGGGAEDVPDVNDVLVVEPGQYLDLSQSSLTISLVFKWTDLLDRNLRQRIKNYQLN